MLAVYKARLASMGADLAGVVRRKAPHAVAGIGQQTGSNERL